jgi:2-oxo-4-hydroxy-4-carboxy-5-ureidoimidazoline decarboxylase
MKTRLSELNTCDVDRFEAVCGTFFEHSPWFAGRAARGRPFADLALLHEALVAEVEQAPTDEQVALVRAHPDLVGRLAREGRLTGESTREQTAAGLAGLTDDEIRLFDRYNQAYHLQFGFPFVICARENKKDAILAAFPTRLKNSREQELRTALAEIYKIARLRLFDAVAEE